ncbi:hypothetical protein [Microbulbifer sp. THAF38]|uniref:hypothetical protein n=1 Tax=Microbulbifer sp. THAF38 TaxID=2587856 RepID=UPI00126849BE|nr:hypothetical protein [Microbulbifer sp. THAF38]QFT55560.1 hypothetical protein FIU95_13480 [Microbulbifer sp. THAF38]
MKAYSIIFVSIINLLSLNDTLANESMNNVLEDSNYNSLKSISERSIVNESISHSDIVQLTKRASFKVIKSSISIQTILSVDGKSVTFITEKSRSNPGFLNITIRVANANYNMELDPKESEFVLSGYGSKLGAEGKLLMATITAKMEENNWHKSENLYKSNSYWIANWFTEMPAGMIMHTIIQESSPKRANQTLIIDNPLHRKHTSGAEIINTHRIV